VQDQRCHLECSASPHSNLQHLQPCPDCSACMLQAREAAAATPAKRSRDGRPRRAAAAGRRAAYAEDDDDPDYFAGPSTGPLDALAAVGAVRAGIQTPGYPELQLLPFMQA
jgi:hypothetical protein